MINTWKRASAIVLIACICSFFCQVGLARAQDEEPPKEPQRETSIKVDVDLYEWWVSRWGDSRALCQVIVDHPGLPDTEEIYKACSEEVYEEWVYTPPCEVNPLTLNYGDCEGLTLHLVGQGRGQRQIAVELPPPTVWLSVTNCNAVPPETHCTTPPTLLLSGEEQLPNEHIIRIQGEIGGIPFSCPGNACEIAFPPTGTQGQNMTFWVDSSFGDSSPQYTALVRLMPWGDFMAPEGPRSAQKLWYMDVLSSQWRGDRPASCSQTWSALPDVSGPPAWLTTPNDPAQLESSISYYYLAAMLIEHGIVDASSCPRFGLADTHLANPCGVQTALPQMLAWQNRFDEEILQVSQDTGVPGQLLKNIFSRESQLWPGIYKSYEETGFGQLTEKGADTTLLWNPDFFEQFCPLVLSSDTCNLGFGNLAEDQQNILRGALVQKVNAACPDCPQGIDLSEAAFSVRVFAESLLANCEQVGQILANTTFRPAGEVSKYEDLWRFTLVNYNAGPGCLSSAIERTLADGGALNWGNVSSRLDPVCADAVRYVDDIVTVRRLEPTPSPTSWVVFMAVSTPTPGLPENEAKPPQPQDTPIPGQPTPTPMPTPGPGALQTPTTIPYP